MEEDCPAQGIAGFALVEAGVAPLAQIWIRQPLQGKKCALDTPEWAPSMSIAWEKSRRHADPTMSVGNMRAPLRNRDSAPQRKHAA
jgi:hypothetical protein